MSNKDLALSEYEEQTFEGLTLHEGEVAARSFHACVFHCCSFVQTAFRDCRFIDCTFIDCDLSLCRVEGCTFATTRFRQSQLMPINWTEASWPRRGLFRSIDFNDCVLNHSTFIGLGLRGITLTSCLARDVDFAETDLLRADCTHSDFSDSRFLHTNLTEADFTGATGYAIDAGLNVLKKTRFSLPEAMSLLCSLDIVLTE